MRRTPISNPASQAHNKPTITPTTKATGIINNLDPVRYGYFSPIIAPLIYLNHHKGNSLGVGNLRGWVLPLINPLIRLRQWIEGEQEIPDVSAQFLMPIEEDNDSGLVLVLIAKRVSLPNCELGKSAVIPALTPHDHNS